MPTKKIFFVIPAYNVSKYLPSVLKRIPKVVWKKKPHILIVNDASQDDTLQVAKALSKKYKKVTVLNKLVNEGYAKAQKSGFKIALKKGADIVVSLHGDGQYTPKKLPVLLRPLEEGTADVVVGSRMLSGKALEGGMPLYKYIANKALTFIENKAYGLNVSEYHTGYLLYSKKTLQRIDFMRLTDTFHFDGEMILMSHSKGFRVTEIPIPTIYSGQKSHVKPIKYGFDVLKIVWNYKRGKYNF